jgi:hypothetical protein
MQLKRMLIRSVSSLFILAVLHCMILDSLLLLWDTEDFFVLIDFLCNTLLIVQCKQLAIFVGFHELLHMRE